jgi:ferrous iron transport protein B
VKIALAGNPNSGKTTLFNAITGKTESVGNWPGVTVDKKEANLKQTFAAAARQHFPNSSGARGQRPDPIRVVDLPGAYSITPYTQEESITRNFILNESIDVIINIIDAGSLERSLFFTTQLLELGLPVVIALNKQDLLRRHGSSIDIEKLSQWLRCPVVPVTAHSGHGLKTLIQEALDLAHSQNSPPAPAFTGKGTPEEDLARQQFVKTIAADVLRRGRDSGPSPLGAADFCPGSVAHLSAGNPGDWRQCLPVPARYRLWQDRP